ncbi:hypothetical protein BC835DRAFT_256798 [Cytidiella melzeri]|nr:hypothetical protein BC835DRAFT_256798 [Cytidiella melzeri]
MKHTTFGRALTETETQDTLVEEMRLALSQTSAADRFSECPCPECAAAVSTDETDLLETVGGIVQPSGSTSEWKASLEDRANWSLTRTTRVESVINLFDDVTRARILAVVPQAVIELEAPSLLVDKVPLHRLFSSKTGIHFYTTKSAEVDSAVRSYGYNYETLACHILPEQAENTVPLYRIHKGNKPLYTIDPEERAKADVGGPAHGLVGFVHATQQTGTFPLYRIFNPRTNAYLFTTNVNEKESLLNVGWNNEGVACYVYL